MTFEVWLRLSAFLWVLLLCALFERRMPKAQLAFSQTLTLADQPDPDPAEYRIGPTDIGCLCHHRRYLGR